MRKYGDAGDSPAGTGVSRRAMLVGSGGLMIATAVGWTSGGLVSERLDQAPGRGGAAAESPPRARKAAWVTKSKDTRHRARRRAARHARVTRDVVPGEPVHYLDDGPKVIALTIDDGPSPVYTPQILALLEKYRVTASFSMIGESVTYYPGIARDVADAGHVIVNHTWDHADLPRLTAAQTRAEISRASDVIHSAVGKRPEMFRAPYGAWSPAALQYCAIEGLTPLDWSVDPRDWSRPGVQKIVRTIMATTRTGSIILEHDGGGDRSQTVAALKIAIPRLLDQGYRFATP
jgi:peptidoglycan-N-acetylglucosamine deacetylase